MKKKVLNGSLSQTGALLKPDEALAIGLIDAIATSDVELQTQCDARLEKYTSVPVCDFCFLLETR